MGPELNFDESIAVSLHLHKHCIETAAKQEYRLLAGRYYDTAEPETSMLEYKIELLQEFIENTDFGALRSSDARLSGEVESDVVIYRHGDGGIGLEIR